MILDTFYLLFKTDISTSTQKEIAGLDKQIDELTKKGKKRSDEEEKQYKELKKQRKETSDAFKDQQKQVEKIGDSFTDAAQKGLSALTAFASFQGIKNGIFDAARLNSSLEIQSKITGQNIDELRAYSAAVETAGGSAEGFTSTVYSMTQAAAQNGVAFTKVSGLFDSLHRQIRNLPPQEQIRQLGLAGITDPATIAFLTQTNEQYAKSIELQRKLTSATREDYEAARTFEAARSDATHALTSAFTRLGSDVLPVASKKLSEFDDYLKDIQKEKGGVESFFTETAAVAIAAWTPLGRLFIAILAAAAQIGAAEGDIAHPDRPRKSFLGKAAGTVSETLLDWYYGPVKRSAPASESLNSPPKTGSPAIDFWIAQGYTPGQAAGIVANEQRESGGNPAARNFQKGIHYGLYQWDEKRRSQIQAATGIDVASASAYDQRRAAAWEMHQRGDDSRIKTAANPELSAALTNRYFEISGENPLERMRLAHRLAAQYYQDVPVSPVGAATLNGASKTISVKVGEVNVHTQATDAIGLSREVGNALSKEIHMAFSDIDDGQDR